MQEVLPKPGEASCHEPVAGREYTTSQLRTKLQQGFYPAEIIEQAIAYVAGFHYIDDLRYAVDYITYHEDSRSRRRIEQDLQGRGIGSDHRRGMAGLAGEMAGSRMNRV